MVATMNNFPVVLDIIFCYNKDKEVVWTINRKLNGTVDITGFERVEFLHRLEIV